MAGLFERAVLAYQAGKFNKAERLCHQVLKQDATHFDALHLMGVIKSRLKEFADAVALFDKAAILRPNNAGLHNHRGAALTEIERFDEALEAYDRALAIRDHFPDAHNNRGCLLMFMERYEDALASYGRALVLDPENADIMNNLGRAFVRLKRYEDALDCFADALAVRPDYLDALVNKGVALAEIKCYDEAAVVFSDVIEKSGDKIEPLQKRAGALNGAKRFGEALADFDRAIELAPGRPGLWIGRAMTLASLKRIGDALGSLEKAQALGCSRFDFVLNRAMVLTACDRLDDAIAGSEEAIALEPANPHSHNVHGLANMAAERFAEAIKSFKQALILKPDFAFVEWNLGYLSLLTGDFDEGWRRYEGRRRTDGTRWTRLDGPEWDGQPLDGMRLLLYAEQANGDAIHFARYVGVMADRGATVILGVYPSLAGLLRNVRGKPEITLHGEHTPPYHYHLPLLSVPFALKQFAEQDIPSDPYLEADPVRVAQWAEVLSRFPGFKAGIAWQGSLSIPGRSIPLAAFAPLGAIPGVTLISLQKTDGLEQLAHLPEGMKVETLGPGFDAGKDAFLDTAAVMMELDLIVTCDTAIAHLAGALGRPVWIVLKTVPDWRWMIDRTDSPWYASARLFRRRKDDDWFAVMQEVADALTALLKQA